MKTIKYKIVAGEINHGTEEEPNIERILQDKEIICNTKAQYEANLPIAEMEAIPGTLDTDPDGEFEPVSDELTDKERIAQLEEALEMILSGAVE